MDAKLRYILSLIAILGFLWASYKLNQKAKLMTDTKAIFNC